MWMTTLLFAVVVLCQSLSVLATDESYTGYILHEIAGNNGNQVSCLVQKPDAETVPVLKEIQGYPDLVNVFLECQLWTVTNTTLPTGTFDQMLISVKNNSNHQIARISSNDPVISTSGTDVLFALNGQLHGSKLSDFIYHSPETPLDIAFAGSGRISAFCWTVGDDLGDGLSGVKTVSFSGTNVCTGGATDWLFIEENQCASNPCQNGGTCSQLQGTFQCDCTEDFYGDDCSQAKPCVSDPCQNGGSCTNLLEVNDFTCDCEADFCGKTCSDACTLGCLNNRTSRFDACQRKDYRRAMRVKESMLMCQKNKCKAVPLNDLDRCGNQCRALDCVETAILEHQCRYESHSEGYTDKSSHGHRTGSRRSRGQWNNERSSSSSSSSSGSSQSKLRKRCFLGADTKSCNRKIQ